MRGAGKSRRWGHFVGSIWPVVLCGGEGARLWPLSRPERPKQFQPLLGAESSFQEAVRRLAGRPGVRMPIVVTGARHEPIAREQLDAVGQQALLLCEPHPLGSAAAVGVAAAWLDHVAPDDIAVAMPADHHIPDRDGFWECLRDAIAAAEAGHIATLGVTPTEPSTSFGYIAAGEALEGCAGSARVERFVEKPAEAAAREYVARECLWNSGIFIFRPRVLLDEMKRYAPALETAVRRAVTDVGECDSRDTIPLSADCFDGVSVTSLDYAVMEHTRRATVTRATVPWFDLGTWNVVASLLKSESGNVVVGRDIVERDNEGCLIRVSGAQVAVFGQRNTAVIVEDGAVLVCDLATSEPVKIAAAQFRDLRRLQSVSPFPAFTTLGEASAALDRWLDASALPLWWSLGADHAHGGIHELLDERAQPVSANRRLRVQARQAYVYSRAIEEGWSGPARVAHAHALAYLPERYRREDGLFRTLVASDGSPADDRALLYDQAFVLLALSAAHRRGDVEALPRAHALLDLLERDWRHRLGGFRAGQSADAPLLSNPHMHLLEAALEWCTATKDTRWLSLAKASVDLCRDRFVDPAMGAVLETCLAEGAPRSEARVEPGHQFEWAHLLLRYADAAGELDFVPFAARLYEIGNKGVDTARGVAVNALTADLVVNDADARLWPQTERARAALALAKRSSASQRGAYERDALAAYGSIARYLETDVPGLWRDTMLPDGSLTREPSPASSLYHLASAIWDLRAYCAQTD